MGFQTEVFTMQPFPFRRSARRLFVSVEVEGLSGVFLGETGDIGGTGTDDFGFPASQAPGTTRAQIAYVQLSADGTTGGLDAEVVCDGVTINFATALSIPAGVSNFIIPAVPGQYVASDVTFNWVCTAAAFNIVLYGNWEP